MMNPGKAPQGNKRKKSCRKTAVVDGQQTSKKSTVRGLGPKIVVGMDFGTTYSGFAYAQVSDMKQVFVFYDWPDQASAGAKPYCKTETSIRYIPGEREGEYHVKDWGWTATYNHKTALQKTRSSTWGEQSDPKSHLVKKFKLHLAPSKYNPGALSTSTRSLPVELTGERTTTDYLQLLSSFIMGRLENTFGASVMKEDVQWCLTVPAMWDDLAKHQMIKCAEMAGMVKGPKCQDPCASPHQIIIVLEPEAASVYCQTKLEEAHFGKGSKFLVVDAGGGTVDLVAHEKVESSGMKMREVACSTGGLCGGTYIDRSFHNFVASKIGCYEDFQEEFPATSLRLQQFMEDVKCCYDGEPSYYEVLDIPAKLASAWEAHEKAKGSGQDLDDDITYDELIIRGADFKTIFDEVVDQILELIRAQVREVPDLQGIMVVGGFSNSPYLMRRIREEFSPRIQHILNPLEPGSAVCRGAVAFGAIDAEVMLSRKSKKTYGLSMSRPFRMGDEAKYLYEECGQSYCRNVFSIFIKKGDDVPVNHKVKHLYEVPLGLRLTEVDIYATEETDPEYVTDDGVVNIGSWKYTLPATAQRMAELPSIEIGMFFGRTTIDVQVVAQNFKGKKASMSFSFEKAFH